MIPSTFKTGKSVGQPEGFTADGYYLGKIPSNFVPFQNTYPLPHIGSRVTVDIHPRLNDLFPTPNMPSRLTGRRIASFDPLLAEQFRKVYGRGDEFNEERGDKITYASKPEPKEEKTQEMLLTVQDVARLHGEDSLRRIYGPAR